MICYIELEKTCDGMSTTRVRVTSWCTLVVDRSRNQHDAAADTDEKKSEQSSEQTNRQTDGLEVNNGSCN